jgi:prevent-host-death family protein
MARLTATQAARNFSEVLNRVAAGEEIEVTRNGQTIALMTPPPVRGLSAERFVELMARAPTPDPEFAAELRAARAALGPPRDPWQS